MTSRRVQLFPVLTLLAALTLPAGALEARDAPRPERWAQPIDDPTLPNLHKVSDTLYRGAQPDEAGMKRLQAMGIKTVVNLRSAHSDEDEIQGTTLSLVEIPWFPTKVRDEDVEAALRILIDPERQPVFWHCKHGADRTGLINAAYRIIVQGWPRQAALDEMVDGGYGFHKIWIKLPKYLKEADFDTMRARLGLKKTGEKTREKAK
jgi:protein tyrosine/serine phosphatase